MKYKLFAQCVTHVAWHLRHSCSGLQGSIQMLRSSMYVVKHLQMEMLHVDEEV